MGDDAKKTIKLSSTQSRQNNSLKQILAEEKIFSIAIDVAIIEQFFGIHTSFEKSLAAAQVIESDL